MLRGTGTPGTPRTTTPGRRGALIGASAAVVCLGAALAACGAGGPREGYVATGAAGGAPRASGTAAAPTGEVTLGPLDGDRAGGDSPAGGGSSGGAPDPGGTGGSSGVPQQAVPAPDTGASSSRD